MIVLVPKTAAIKAKLLGYQLNHIAFELPADQFGAQYETLIVTGYKIRESKHPVPASHTMYIDDPDGNEVEFKGVLMKPRVIPMPFDQSMSVRRSQYRMLDSQ